MAPVLRTRRCSGAARAVTAGHYRSGGARLTHAPTAPTHAQAGHDGAHLHASALRAPRPLAEPARPGQRRQALQRGRHPRAGGDALLPAPAAAGTRQAARRHHARLPRPRGQGLRRHGPGARRPRRHQGACLLCPSSARRPHRALLRRRPWEAGWPGSAGRPPVGAGAGRAGSGHVWRTAGHYVSAPAAVGRLPIWPGAPRSAPPVPNEADIRTSPPNAPQVVRLDCLTIDPIENPFNEASALQLLRAGAFGPKPRTIIDVEDVFQVSRVTARPSGPAGGSGFSPTGLGRPRWGLGRGQFGAGLTHGPLIHTNRTPSTSTSSRPGPPVRTAGRESALIRLLLGVLLGVRVLLFCGSPLRPPGYSQTNVQRPAGMQAFGAAPPTPQQLNRPPPFPPPPPPPHRPLGPFGRPHGHLPHSLLRNIHPPSHNRRGSLQLRLAAARGPAAYPGAARLQVPAPAHRRARLPQGRGHRAPVSGVGCGCVRM